jgi:hypothetical protein
MKASAFATLASNLPTGAVPRDYVLTFAGAGEQVIHARGRHLRVLEAATAPVYVQIDGSGELYRRAGQGINVSAPFSKFTVRSTVAQSVRVCVSEERQDDDSESVAVSVTATVAPGDTLETVADVSIGAAASAVIVGADATRRVVIIKNLSSNTDAIRIGEAGGVGAARGHELEPGESIALATTSAVSAYNTKAGGAQSVSVVSIKDV